jgi:hypothetical protein
VSEDTARPDTSFFKLRNWRTSQSEREFVRSVYATNLLTPRERRTLAVYHSATFIQLHAAKSYYRAVLDRTDGIVAQDDEEAVAQFFVLLEIDCAATIRAAWSALDCLAHEINLICWRQAGRQDLYHPYVQEKKISFYMVRQKLLASDKMKRSSITRFLDEQTRDTKTRDESYILLSNCAMRILHRPLLLGCRLLQPAGGRLKILLSEGEGMPRDRAFSLQEIEIPRAFEMILDWLESFIDQVYLTLTNTQRSKD